MNNQNAAVILVVDDDKEIVAAISDLLRRDGYSILRAYDGMEALDLVFSNDIQLILMGVMMPRMDGISAMMEIRKEKNIPIIILSAKSEDSDKVLGLSLGADDYVTKPYSPTELIARVKSCLRRYLSLGANVKSSSTIVNGSIALDTTEKQLYVDGEKVHLTATEYKIMNLLMDHPGRIFPAEEIYSRCWRDISYNVESTVMVHIRRIREKIEINPKDPKYLKVVWGIGYKIEKV